MVPLSPVGQNPVQALVRRVGTPVPGRPGLVVAAPGAGKTALLLHLAERAAADGVRTLVLSFGTTLPHLKAQHAEVVRAGWAPGGVSMGRVLLLAVPASADVAAIVRQAEALRSSGAFAAERVVVDGLPPTDASLRDLVDGSRQLDLPVWAAMTRDGAVPLAWRQAVGPILRLEGSGDTMSLRDGDGALLPWSLDPSSWRVGDAQGAPPVGIRWVHGGAEGAEAAFGEAAEATGLEERSVTWAGRRPSRSVGLVVLDQQTLAEDAVTVQDAEEVLGRRFSESETLRRVLRLQAALAASADEVVVVGTLRGDGTVSGGTGWAVEVAKRRQQPLWVFDQHTERWLAWTDGAWVDGAVEAPALHGPVICGTGTRQLSAAGRAAIEKVVALSARGGRGAVDPPGAADG